MRVTVVGSGFVGATTAMRVVQKCLAEVVLIDVIEGLPQGIALDIKESSPVEGFEPRVTGTNDYADTAGSDLVVITNPLDEMTFLAAEVAAFPRERVMGMAGVLDSARLRYFIAEELGESPQGVQAMTLGSHGESMVPLPRQATVNGKPLTELVDEATLERLYQRTRDAGAEIVGLLKKGSAYYAPSAAIAQMVNAIAGDTNEVLPVCEWCTGQFGIDGVYVGVPAKLGRRGVEEVVELDLSEQELSQLREA